MRSNMLELLFANESEVLELKASVRDPRLLAKLIGSFANAQGGTIVIGVKEPYEVVGVDEELTRRVYEASRHRVTPEPRTELSFVEFDGKQVAVIDVERSTEIVLSEGSAFVRSGAVTQPMAWTQMRKHLPSQPSVSMIESLTRAIEQQSKRIEEMHEQLCAANTWWARLKANGIGFLIGVLASVIASFLYALF